jgi:thymidylate kinase
MHNLLIISGKPRSGKTTLANFIASGYKKEEVFRTNTVKIGEPFSIPLKTKLIIIDEQPKPMVMVMDYLIAFSNQKEIKIHVQSEPAQMIATPKVIIITQEWAMLGKRYDVIRCKRVPAL